MYLEKTDYFLEGSGPLLIKTAQSAVSKNRAEKIRAWERSLHYFFTSNNKSNFHSQEFTRFLSTVSSQRRATRLNASIQTM